MQQAAQYHLVPFNPDEVRVERPKAVRGKQGKARTASKRAKGATAAASSTHRKTL